VSDDVPLAWTPGRVSAPAMTDDGWRARYPLWDGYFAVVAAAVTGFVVAGGRSSAQTLGGLALLAALAAWYVGYGRRLMRDDVDDARGLVYLAGAFVLYVPAVALTGSASFALFALCPQAFMVLPAVPATVVVVAFNAVHLVALAVRGADLAALLAGPLPIAALVVVFSALFGTWAQRTVALSEERATLIRALDASRAESARLSHEAGVLAERERLARDIHDTIAQGLSSVVMLIQAARAEPRTADAHLALALSTARDNLDEARALVAALTPPPLAGASLPAALQRVASAASASFTVTGTPRPVPTAVEVVLLRALQEALANARKHAGAAAVAVSLSYPGGGVALSVADDGCGFDPSAPTGTGYGLRGMRARVEQVGGSLSVVSAAGAGTTVEVVVP